MSTPSARRALLFDTPSRPSKRARISKMSRRRAPMRVPRSLLPEMKQFTKSSLASSGSSVAGSSVATDMSQGDNSTQFIGSKFRVKRLRVNYDLSDVSPSSYGYRFLVYIPKRASTSVTALPVSTIAPIDTSQYTVLFDRILSRDASLTAGTFDVPMNLLIETDVDGNSVYRNDLRIAAYATGFGASVRTRVDYAVWFTDS